MTCCCSLAEKVTDYHTEKTKLKSFIGLAIESGLSLRTGTEAQGHPTRSLSGLGQGNLVDNICLGYPSSRYFGYAFGPRAGSWKVLNVPPRQT